MDPIKDIVKRTYDAYRTNHRSKLQNEGRKTLKFLVLMQKKRLRTIFLSEYNM